MKRYLTNNIVLKIVSIILAALLWLLIININDPIITETFYDIPVKVVNESVVTDRGYQYNIEAGEKISIKVRGKRSVVDNLVESGFAASADFKTLSNMDHANITVSYPGYDETQLELTPKTEVMSIRLEESETLPFNVRVITVGEVREGYHILAAKTTIGPNIVQIEGSKTQVGNIEEVTVEIDVSGKKESFVTTAVPLAYDKEGNPVDAAKINYSVKEVQVSFVVVPTKMIDLVVVTTGEPGYGYYSAEPEFAPNSVLIAADEDILSEIDKLTIPCDITGITEQLDTEFDIQEALKKEYGDDVILVDTNNRSVGVLIKIEKLERMDFPLGQREIEIRGIPAGMTVAFQTPGNLQLKLLGRPDDLKAITTDELEPYINLGDLASTAGTYTVSIRSDYVGDVLVEPGSAVVVLRLKEDEE